MRCPEAPVPWTTMAESVPWKSGWLAACARAASEIRRDADKYESNACGRTDPEGENWDEGFLEGMRWAAHLIEWNP